MKKLLIIFCCALVLGSSVRAQIQTNLEEPKSLLNEINLRICVSGTEIASAEYMRAVIKTAVDENGNDLINPRRGGSPFHRVSASDKINVKLKNLGGTTIKEISGEVEVFVSKNDPDSVVPIDLKKEIGKPVESTILNEAGITIIIYNRELIDAVKSKAVDDPEALKSFSRGNVGRENTIALRIKDPNLRFVGAGFRDANGNPLGSHAALIPSQTPNKMAMYDLYAEAYRLLFFISTPKSLIKVPFSYHDVAVTKTR